MKVTIYTGDGLYVNDECVEELLYCKTISFEFMPRKHDIINFDGNEFEVGLVIIDVDKNKYEIYAESTRTDNSDHFKITRKRYEKNGWIGC